MEEGPQECNKMRDQKPFHRRTVKISQGDPAICEVLASPSVGQFCYELPTLHKGTRLGDLHSEIENMRILS